MTTMPLTYFAMWTCHCSFLAYTKDEIPHRCPTHDANYMPGGAPELTTFNPPIHYGYQPQCGCPHHAKEAAEP